MVLWLWHRPAVVAPIEPQAWEPPHATGVALKSEREKKRKKKEKAKASRNVKKDNQNIILSPWTLNNTTSYDHHKSKRWNKKTKTP